MTVDPRPETNRDPDMHDLWTWGWVPWAEATRLLHAADGVWLAPSGIARRSGDPWPTEMPLTTRIHAWDDASSLQWRLIPSPTRGKVLLTCLSEIGICLKGAQSRRVRATCERGGEWDRTWVFEAAAIMFLRAAKASGMEDR